MIKDLVNQLAKECEKQSLNYMIVVEDEGIHDTYSVTGNTKIRELVDTLKRVQGQEE